MFRKRLKKLLKEFRYHREKAAQYAFTRLPFENPTKFLSSIKLPKSTESICVVGFGGSSLGAKIMYGATGCKDAPGLYFVDNLDLDMFEWNFSLALPYTNKFFLFISKSGETIEVLSLAKYFLKYIKKPSRNCLVMTDKQNSSLGALAKKYGIKIIPSPHQIPGRFSVLSIVGLLPLYLGGYDILALLRGARSVSWKSAYRLACEQYLHFQQGRNITVLFPYLEKLDGFCDWYIQLLAESIGKSKKIGITPMKAMGVKDQHSKLQLFLDGPDDKFFILLRPKKFRFPAKIPGESYTLGHLIEAEYAGVKKAFQKRKRPFFELTFSDVHEETLGRLFYFFELQVAFLGLLFGINFENQPAVELSKNYTKKELRKK